MIQNYSDPIVTLNQVYKASEEGIAPTLGACVIGPHYIVRKHEDFGSALRLDSADNYSSNSYTTAYSYAAGLAARPYPARETADSGVDTATAKVLVKNAKLLYKTFTAGAGTVIATFDTDEVSGVDTFSVTENGVAFKFRDPYADGSAVMPQAGDIIILTYTVGSDSAEALTETTIAGFMKENGSYTKCVTTKSLEAGAVISKIEMLRVADCYVDGTSIAATDSMIAVLGSAVSEKINIGSDEANNYPIYGGAFYAEYRVFSKKFATNFGYAASTDYLEEVLGKICPENPLGIAVANAIEESAGNFVYFVGLESDPSDSVELVSAYTKAADLIADKDSIYGIVPCTSSAAVAEALLQFVEKQSSEEVPYFKYLSIGVDIPETTQMLPTKEVSLEIGAVSSDSGYTKIVFTTSALLQVGTIVAGDIFKFGQFEAPIKKSNHKNAIWLDGDYMVSVNNPANRPIAIFKKLTNNADIIQAIVDAKPFANKRCSFCIADGAVYNGTMEVPNYCVAAALAGKRSGSEPHAPLSNVAMKAITCTEKHGFTASQSKVLGANGFWRVGMREDGTCISRRQLTSAATGDVNYDEQSIVCNMDSIALSLKVTGRDLVGNTNISPVLLNILEAELNNKLDQFKVYTNDFIGPQLLSGQILSIKQDAVYKDRIYADLEGEPPKPFNRFHITFYMR